MTKHQQRHAAAVSDQTMTSSKQSNPHHPRQLSSSHLLPRWYNRQCDIVLRPIEMQVVITHQLGLWSVFGVIVLKDSRSLCVDRADLEDNLATLLYYTACRPYFDIHGIDLSSFNRLYVSTKIVLVRQPISVARVLGIDVAETRS